MLSSLTSRLGAQTSPEVPDFIHVVRQRLEIFREMIVRVGEDKNPQRFRIHSAVILNVRSRKHKPANANRRCFSA